MTYPRPDEVPVGHDQAARNDQERPDSGSIYAWARRAPVERATLPAAGVIWSASAIMHAMGMAGIWPALAGLGVAGFAYRKASRRQRRHRKREQMRRNHGTDAAGVVAVVTAWLAAAVQFGPLAGPWAPLSVAWGLITLGGYWWLRGHEGVRHARHWRHRRMSWLGEAHALGIGGSHMVDHEVTRLGEAFELDTTGTGQLASAIVSGSLAERYAQRKMLPESRVRVSKGTIAGRIRVSVRERDPWAQPSPHPFLDPDPEIILPDPDTIRRPAVIGLDPETGSPLEVPLRDEAGGKRVVVIGTTRMAGKTVLVNSLRAKVAACPDALIVDINLSKAIEDRAWAPVCHLTAVGPDQARRAQQIMNLLVKIIAIRPKLRDTAVFEPSREHPQIVLFVDEVDAASPHIRQQLQYVMSKGGSEGVTVVIAGQRGTADWLGGGNIRALVDVFCVGMVSRQGEQVHAAGNLGFEMPDMSSYGEGHRGVWAVAELGSSPATGRTFLFREPADIRRVAHARAHWQPVLEPALADGLGERYEQLLASDVFAEWAATDEGAAARSGAPPRCGEPDDETGHEEAPAVTDPEPGPPAGPQPEVSPDTGDLETWLEADVDPDFPDDPAERLGHMRQKAAGIRRLAAEADALEAALPLVDPAKLAASAREQWAEAVAQNPIPDDVLPRLLGLLAGEGTSARAAAAQLGTPNTQTLFWFRGLAEEGRIRRTGKGPAARWILTDSDDAGE